MISRHSAGSYRAVKQSERIMMSPSDVPLAAARVVKTAAPGVIQHRPNAALHNTLVTVRHPHDCYSVTARCPSRPLLCYCPAPLTNAILLLPSTPHDCYSVTARHPSRLLLC